MKHRIGRIVRIGPALGYDVGKMSAGRLVYLFIYLFIIVVVVVVAAAAVVVILYNHFLKLHCYWKIVMHVIVYEFMCISYTPRHNIVQLSENIQYMQKCDTFEQCMESCLHLCGVVNS